MSTYRIITDSCCDLTQEMADELNLLCVPLYVNYKGQSFANKLDQSELNTKAFYDGMRTGEMATTNAVNPVQWKEAAEPVDPLKNTLKDLADHSKDLTDLFAGRCRFLPVVTAFLPKFLQLAHKPPPA